MEFLKNLGIKEKNFGSSTGTKWNETTDNGELKIYSPATGEFIASVYQASENDLEKVMTSAEEAFK
jgi:aldehyde dehydrogenase (NAD+)